jgi:hypothetical protein
VFSIFRNIVEQRRRGRPLRVDDQDPDSENYDWEGFAKSLIKETMEREGLGYPELSSRLDKMEVNIEAKALNRRINRGKFSAGFFLACMGALDVKALKFQHECAGEAVVRSKRRKLRTDVVTSPRK